VEGIFKYVYDQIVEEKMVRDPCWVIVCHIYSLRYHNLFRWYTLWQIPFLSASILLLLLLALRPHHSETNKKIKKK